MTTTADNPMLFPGADEGAPKKKRTLAAKVKQLDAEALIPNLGKPVAVPVPDFSVPNRPKTCLEVDFPIVPINALSALEGNAGKPIYQMSKWWARRRSCVFRAMLLAAATQAPVRKNPDGSPQVDADGVPVPDDAEAHKAVWDVYYANHQAAGSFKNLKVLDCFMGGGTTLVEGSRLGFQVAGVDLNPVAWFIVKNELSGVDPAQVKRLFDRIEAEVKPVIQPFYVTDCPRGHRGRWIDTRKETTTTDLNGEPVTTPPPEAVMPMDFDPIRLPPEDRKPYRYEGPEVIYTFWAKHGPCAKEGCNHRTPMFRTPVIATKRLGVKFIELTCKKCKTAFHAELGTPRMAPGAEHVVLDTETPFTNLSQPFARELLEYGEGGKADKIGRAMGLLERVDDEPGLRCPKCGEFAGQFLRDVLTAHRRATRAADIDKKALKIMPKGNGVKHVYCHLLVDPEWLAGSPGKIDGEELGGQPDASPEATAQWYAQRLNRLRLIEVRGVAGAQAPAADDEESAGQNGDGEEAAAAEADAEAGLPPEIRLADGRVIKTGQGNIPKESHFSCGSCGQLQDFRFSVQATQKAPAVAIYAVQGYCPECDRQRRIYGGRFFTVPTAADVRRAEATEAEWRERCDGDLKDFWPREELPHSYMTHQANFPLPAMGYTHWWKMFNARQLLTHAQLGRAISALSCEEPERLAVLAAAQQYLQNHSVFCHYEIGWDKLAVTFANANYRIRLLHLENSFATPIGRGNWRSCAEGIVDGLRWAAEPADVFISATGGSSKVQPGDRAKAEAQLLCQSSTELPQLHSGSFDLAITDPPFGDNIFYSDLSNFFYAWLRLPLKSRYPDLFEPVRTPHFQEALAPRAMPEAEANARYEMLLTGCWHEAYRVMKDGGILAFTFHHSEDAQWAIVLRSLFEAGFILEATYPVASDEMKGVGGQFGAKGTEYDIIHVCRKRLADPTKVSWAKMRQYVKSELQRMRGLLDSYKARELSEADIRVILRGKALEFYSRHYGQVFTAEESPLSIRDALLGINQLLDEDTGGPAERPPSKVQPLVYQFLRLFGPRMALSRDDVSKSLRGTGIVQRELEHLGWVREDDKIVRVVPIPERFDIARQRPRREMKTELDQAHFLIGAAMPNSGVNIEEELARGTWMVRRSVEATLEWYAKTSLDPQIAEAARLAATLLRQSIEANRAKLVQEQGFLFDLDEVA